MKPTPSPQTPAAAAAAAGFTRYQRAVAGMLAFLQFAVILDFMLMSPLGAVIMPTLQISPQKFGLVVSAYAFSAGLSGLLTAGFADRFDRKKLLLIFYTGFIVGTIWCGLAPTYPMLLAARVVTGLFGGVIGSVVMAIATDLFAPQLRGRVMGVIQTAFAASQVLGLPVGLYLSNHWDWHAPFLAMAGIGAVGGLIVAWRMKPVTDHLAAHQESSAFGHLLATVAEPRHLIAFATTALLTTGGFMLMPFSSAFTVNNLGVGLTSLPMIYLITGCCTIFAGPLIGKLADTVGKLPVFMAGSTITVVMVVIYTHLGQVPFATVVIVNVILFVGIFSRMIPYQALVSSVPEARQRGAFNSISAAVQQLSGGLASLVAGSIVSLGPEGKLQHFEVIGYVMVGTTLLSAVMITLIQRGIRRQALSAPTTTLQPAAA